MRTSLLACAALLVACGCVSATSGPSVPLTLATGEGGASQALVPVFIEGEGPLLFALDTGSSESVVDDATAERLGLEIVEGTEREVTGVGSAEAVQVRVERWALGEIDLGGGQLVRLDLSQPGEGAQLDGLLGSDVLDDYATVTIDYEAERLILSERR